MSYLDMLSWYTTTSSQHLLSGILFQGHSKVQVDVCVDCCSPSHKWCHLRSRLEFDLSVCPCERFCFLAMGLNYRSPHIQPRPSGCLISANIWLIRNSVNPETRNWENKFLSWDKFLWLLPSGYWSGLRLVLIKHLILTKWLLHQAFKFHVSTFWCCKRIA